MVIAAQQAVLEREDVSRLMADIRTLASQLTEDASDMVSYSRGSAQWASHSEAVAQIREHIAAAGQTLARLARHRTDAPPTIRVTIDRVTDLLDRIARGTAQLIQHIDDNPKRLFMAEYGDAIETNCDTVSQFAALIGAFLDFGANTRAHSA